MNEKDRILELVKSGVLSMEEGIQLLEQINENADKSSISLPAKQEEVEFHSVEDLLKADAFQETESFKGKHETDSFEEDTVSGDEEKEDGEDTRLEDEISEDADSTEEQLKKAFEDMKNVAKDGYTQAKPFVKNIVNVVGDAIKVAKQSVEENVDWKEFNLRVPKLASYPFSDERVVEDAAPTILDIKNKNGKILLKKAEDNILKVAVYGKIYGSFESETALEEFYKNSEWNIDNEKITINVSGLRIVSNIELSLPERMYDYISLKSLNGDIELQDVEAGDVYADTTNGKVAIETVKASMVEIKGVNGGVQVKDSKALDILIKSVNSEVVVESMVESLLVNLVNGDVRATLNSDTLKKVEISNVNGNIKTAFPVMLGLNGIATTNFGSIYEKFESTEVLKDSPKQFTVHRMNEKMVEFGLKTTTGVIYMKDAD
ncbi:MAG: DUF4097 family beta strand repeat-containing protein [Streptococcaceae bacterium]|nr:DUF4097 family beta strand repeat-containing protein [Streptococcaceae bacterium]